MCQTIGLACASLLAYRRSLAITSCLLAAVLLPLSSSAQTFTVLHTFSGGSDGAGPAAGLTIDRGGNLYGTAAGGGCDNDGTAFKLMHRNGAWLFNTLYCFTFGLDGFYPRARVVFGPDGSLYGTTWLGGGGPCNGTACGIVFRLQPPLTPCKTTQCPWIETVLYRFGGGSDGANPGYGDLVFDAAGSLYGTTYYGGSSNCIPNGCGVVFELTPSQNGQWIESTLYSFGTSDQDGVFPLGGLTFDSSGNLYGTTSEGGTHLAGTVFELVHSAGWVENTLYSFNRTGDGYLPEAGIIWDPSGNLYGTDAVGGAQNGGTVFELLPAGGSWTETTLYSFASNQTGPVGTLTFDAEGNLYGTTYSSGTNQLGNVFKLTHSNGTWIYSSLHDFTGGSDGRNPIGNVVIDASGNIYGTASGSMPGFGVVWEIMP